MALVKPGMLILGCRWLFFAFLTAAAAVVACGYLPTQMKSSESSCCCGGRSRFSMWRIQLVLLASTTREGLKCPRWSLSQEPPELLLPPVCWSATDGSNCAETNVSQAFIIYSVCCMLLSKVPCGVVSACIFNTSGPTGTMKFHHKPRLMPVFCAQSSEHSDPQQQLGDDQC